MRCLFRCPITGPEVRADGEVERSESMDAIAKRSATGGVLFSIRMWISRLIG